MLKARLESGEFFIAEQVRVPSLYRGLYQRSDGHSTSDDHCWHAFVGMREHIRLPTDECVASSVREFAERFACVETWQEELSPHFSQ